MKILVTGATGMLGRAVMTRFSSQCDFIVTGLCHSRKGEGLISLDLADTRALNAVLEECRPDVVIHTAAIRKPDEFAADVNAARRLNVDATEALARWAGDDPSRFLVYISSDYVFDGTTPPYSPSSPTHAINAYGESKLDGEIVVRKYAERQSAILRVPVLYGQVENLQESSVTTVMEQVLKLRDAVKSGNTPVKPLVLDDWAIRYPTVVLDVAEILIQIVHRKLHGTYHWSGAEAMTKLDMGRVVADIVGIDKTLLKGSGAPANGSEPRPKDCHLDRSDLESLGITTAGIPFAVAMMWLAEKFDR